MPGNAGTGNQENNDFSLRGYSGNTAQRDGVDDSLFTAAPFLSIDAWRQSRVSTS